MNWELLAVLPFFSLTLVIATSYLFRVWKKGRVSFDRVNQQGGSPFLGKSIMEMGYWFFQPLARSLVAMKVTANHASWMSLIFGALAGSCLGYGHFGFGAVFSCLSAVLDSLDGLIARLTEQASDAGEVLDAAVDRYTEFFFIAGLVVYYREIPVLQCLALFTLLGAFMVSYSTAKSEALHISLPKGGMRRPERAVYLTLGAALSPCTIPWLEAFREYPIPVGHPMVLALAVVGLSANMSAVERFFYLARVIREKEKKKDFLTKETESFEANDWAKTLK